ncbi:ASCH domain-containing protein [Nodularia sp. NIES-3585]|uniref:ASCH domain-containing protein n=1 Tax=Nodularia sp. NIES-3585 TaxID=1973477 RepID=UPI000B5C5CC2|nr:ASCH domain-containing protein [Nodularia sp. NIES-3585]GAX37876.1 hypothetical protein NIES3585_39210 [Nodularia sp. NIES-3585]
MKAISLWQPWASLIPLGMKQVETRHWSTRYKGDLLICSARRDNSSQETYFYEVVKPINPKLTYNDFPFGMAVAVVNLKNCLLMTNELISKQTSLEISLGLWEVGRYAWMFDNIRPIKPFEVIGRQGLFEVNFNG